MTSSARDFALLRHLIVPILELLAFEVTFELLAVGGGLFIRGYASRNREKIESLLAPNACLVMLKSFSTMRFTRSFLETMSAKYSIQGLYFASL